MVLARTSADGLLACHQGARHQGEQIAGLGEWVMPFGEMAAVVEIARLKQVAVRQQHRVLGLVGAQQHGVFGHHIRTVEEIGNAAKAFGLALGKEAAARGVEAGQRAVFLWRAGVADFQLEVGIGRGFDHQHLAFDAEGDAFAIDQHAQQIQLFAMQA